MRVLCHGHDPAGLYLAILLKRAGGANSVEIIDAPAMPGCDALVMSSLVRPPRALADRELSATVDAMTQSWPKLAVRRGDETMLSPVGVGTSVSRASLVEALLDRAREVGCAFRPDVPSEGDANTLVILADGDAKRADAAVGLSEEFNKPSPLRWLVVDVTGKLDEASLMVRQTPHGVLHAMLWPTRSGGGTLVIGAPVDAGKEGLDPSRCLAVFAGDLSGLSIRAGEPAWQSTASFSRRRWHSGRTILIGRSAYATHPMLGLDVRQSLEDAEALASLLAGGSSILDALAAWENMRRPLAESLVRADAANIAWLANLHRTMDAPLPQFVYAAVTRTMRIGHADVQRADAELAIAAETIVAGPVRARSGRPPPPMFAPITLRGLTIPNRIAVSPMCMYNAEDGTVGDFQLVHYGSRATGGVGLVLTEMTDVSPEGRISPECAGLWKPEHVPAWRRVVDYVHARTPAKIGVQLGHAGRKGSVRKSWERGPLEPERAWPTLAPSPLLFDKHYVQPREIDRSEMDRIVASYVAATRMADEAGFDMIEMHLAHGYLLSSFISPLSNKRTDAYGGKLANRLRFPLEVFEAVRAAWPQDKPISTRISAFDWIEGGTTIEDAIEIARALKAVGNDIVAVSTGGITAERRPNVGRLYQGTFSDQVRNEAKVATMTVGGVASHTDANMMIAAGRADMCALARGFMYDPYFPLHAAQQQGYHDLEWANEYRNATGLRMRDLW